ncbi:hypothetical protein GCM10010470_23470 [Saccharopolyspora taberi]|uniref:Uncharacterized protein n=1 Tax=Saccharopolyspora taberi TaxID=60895 RepID=A0ABN3VB68_9PSEU
MAVKIVHTLLRQEVRFGSRGAAERYAAEHGGLDVWWVRAVPLATISKTPAHRYRETTAPSPAPRAGHHYGTQQYSQGSYLTDYLSPAPRAGHHHGSFPLGLVQVIAPGCHRRRARPHQLRELVILTGAAKR